MWSLPVPQISDDQCFDTCRSRLRNIDNISKRLDVARPDILALFADYLIKGEQNVLHLISESDVTAGNITKAEMKRLYSSGLRGGGWATFL